MTHNIPMWHATSDGVERAFKYLLQQHQIVTPIFGMQQAVCHVDAVAAAATVCGSNRLAATVWQWWCLYWLQLSRTRCTSNGLFKQLNSAAASRLAAAFVVRMSSSRWCVPHKVNDVATSRCMMAHSHAN